MQTSLWESFLPVLAPQMCLKLFGRMTVSKASTWQKPVSCSSIQSGSNTQDYSLELCDTSTEVAYVNPDLHS